VDGKGLSSAISGPRVSSTDLEYARTLSRWRDGGARVHGCTRVRARPSLTIAATNQFTLDQEERIVRLFSKSLNADPGSGYQASRVLVSSGAVLKQKPPTVPTIDRPPIDRERTSNSGHRRLGTPRGQRDYHSCGARVRVGQTYVQRTDTLRSAAALAAPSSRRRGAPELSFSTTISVSVMSIPPPKALYAASLAANRAAKRARRPAQAIAHR
jgi:hypothetical protein